MSATSVTMSRAVRDRSGQLRNCWAGRNACYAVASLTASPESDPPSWIRGHWHIETALHPYVTYREGRAQIRTGNGSKVMTTIRLPPSETMKLAETTSITATTYPLRHRGSACTQADPDTNAVPRCRGSGKQVLSPTKAEGGIVRVKRGSSGA